MEDKSLANKAINLKGKQYVLVADRVVFFNEEFPEGCITTELLAWDGGKYIVKAVVHPEGIAMGKRYFTGYSQATMGGAGANKDAALENAETSAVGRALAFMGIGVIESIASADEVHKASQTSKTAPGATKAAQTLTGAQVAAKDRIKAALAALGELNDSRREVEDAVFKHTGMKLSIENLEVIGDKLWAIVEKTDPLK